MHQLGNVLANPDIEIDYGQKGKDVQLISKTVDKDEQRQLDSLVETLLAKPLAEWTQGNGHNDRGKWYETDFSVAEGITKLRIGKDTKLTSKPDPFYYLDFFDDKGAMVKSFSYRAPMFSPPDDLEAECKLQILMNLYERLTGKIERAAR